MTSPTLSAELTREHREIDDAIEAFIEKLDCGGLQRELLTDTLVALRRHIYLEEIFLFPPLREAGIVMPIFVMMREHGQLWHTMNTLEDLLADGNDVPRLRDTCTQLLDQLHQHNSKEEPVIYPNADTDLPPQTSAELTRFIEAGRTPDGWVCQQANA
ncbi:MULTISPECIES: hemerythrin domain-containing protein [Mycobacterium avium complex (MAC)]|uniref:Hemerythrin HHE cation binding domain protein n=3 Tax=Mycobacterium intracellulare TaxID=1767 RepID=X8CRT8_MYCIT|nr:MULTISPECIES: hemerythrin domain-containing protein [Mycobacterium avium complex (MAC)]EUA58749.1 hemerythrin HHE cation binding domain protein [Mycobacterium intracellulare 1956]AFC43189.1 hemerythrin HHE cation binding domain-containing protein [Mycobacterium intracellulare ATCC 13950]ANR94143.1 hemerythrin [Mycobacterium avium]AYJ07640.1 hemerythrin domain-containing protein [Mycobacterium avium]ETZ36964.1 hemerythrin HHE cation binding domain protein [Mycobacterium intracellulare MIN_06